MNLVTFIKNIPPAFYGIIIGSLLTIIGVVLTNISNTKRLRLQHEYEREVRNNERDLNMRRDVYMDAMEAISAGITAVSRFSELHESPEALMQSYTDLSPKVSKVMIVAQNDTIKALADFSLELNGAFLRLSAKREQFDAIHLQHQKLENKIVDTQKEIDQLTARLAEEQVRGSTCKEQHRLKQVYETSKTQLSELKSKEEKIGNQLMPFIVSLVQESLDEVGSLQKLLVPLITLFRAELDLPFDEAYYEHTLISGHEKLNEYLVEFFQTHEETQVEEMNP